MPPERRILISVDDDELYPQLPATVLPNSDELLSIALPSLIAIPQHTGIAHLRTKVDIERVIV